MRCVRFCARGVLVAVVILTLNAPAYALPRREREPEPKNPVVRIIKKLTQIVCGDGLITPIP